MTIYALYLFLIGTIFGSFFNVVIHRLPLNKTIIYGTSSCPNCNNRIKPYDLVPLISYLVLKGKCRNCSSPISIRYPIIEAVTGLSYMLVFLRYELSSYFFIGVSLASILIIITMIDIDTMEIYDRFHVLIFILAFINLFISDLSILNHAIGFFIISIPLFILAIITGGIGGGDIKLIAVSGLLLGVANTLVAFFIASVVGGVIAIYLLLFQNKSRKQAIAFGPYLCVGIFASYLYGEHIINWYLNLFF